MSINFWTPVLTTNPQTQLSSTILLPLPTAPPILDLLRFPIPPPLSISASGEISDNLVVPSSSQLTITMASRAKKPPGDQGTPTSMRPARLRVMRPEVEEVLRSPRRGRPKLKDGGGEGAAEDDDGAEPPRYDCAFQDEKGEFAAPEMVWCKVRSYPWWPAQVFDAADASEEALQHAKSGGGAPLVACFWDNTFAWSETSALLPFRANFHSLVGKNTFSKYKYVSAVAAALDEVERRVQAGLSCACVPYARKRQEVQNSGIRKGAYGAVVDEAYMRDTFCGEPFLEYISALGRNPLGGADRLDLATAKSQLRSFNRLRGPRELPEFVTYAGIEDVPTEATPQTKRKRMEKTNNEDDVPSKEKKPRRVESSLRKRDTAKEDAVDEECSVPRKSSARKNKKGTSKDVDKREAPAKKNTMVEASSVPSSKENKPKVSKSLAEKKKKKDSSKYTDKRESLPEPVEEEAMGDDSSTPRAADGTFSKERKSKTSKSSAKMMKKDSSKDIDKGESPPEPAVEDATNEDSSMPSGEATDGTLSKGRKSKVSKSSSKVKKKDISKDTDKKESLPESVEEDAMNEDNSTPSGGVTDGTLRKRGKSKISKSSTKAKKNDISKDVDKKKFLPDPAKEEATGDDSSTPEAADGTLSKERNSKITKSPVKKKKQDTSKDADGVETVGGSKTPVKKAVDGTLSESKSARRLRSMHKTEDASERSKGPRKDDVGETTKGKDKDVALLKENNLGRRASSARQKDKITADGVGLADSSVKDSVSPGKKKSQLGETSVTKDAPISISEHGRKRKKLSELMVETGTPNRSPAGKSKARGKHSLPASTEKPDLDTEGTVKARGKRSLPASTEKPDRDTEDTEDTVETRGKRSLPALTEKPEEPDCDTEDTKKTRGKRSMPALTEKPEDPDRDTKDKMKTRGKRSLPGPTEEPEDPDRDMKDTMKTMKRKKLDTLGDLSSQPPLSPKGSTKGQEATPKAAGKKSQASPVVKANGDALGDSSSQPQPLSPKRFTKARDATRKAAELNPHTSPAVEANSEASQTRSRRNKNSEKPVPDKSPRSVKPNKGKKGATTEDSLSCGEMHSQLCLAASDLKKVGKITPASVGFFTEFSKSSCPSSSDVEKEIPIEAANTDSYASSAHGDKEMTEKATDKVASPQADEEIPEEAANKVASPHADEEIPEKAENKVASPHADEEIPEKPEEAANKVASPHADEEIPEKAANKVSSPHAEEEIPEKATNKVGSPHAEEEVPEKPTEKEPSPSDPPMADHMKEVPEKPTDQEPSPSELPVADHMKEVPEKPTDKEPSPLEPPVGDHMKEVPEKPTDKEPSPSELPVADHMKEVPEKTTDKQLSPSEPPVADHTKEVPEKPTEKEPSPSELPVADHTKEVPEKPTDKEPSPSEPPVADHMKEVSEKPTDEEPSPSEPPVADHMKEVPEKPTEKEPSPSEPPVADHTKEVPEKPTDEEPSPSEPPVADHMKEVPEKSTEKEPSPSELSVADHTKEVPEKPTDKEPSPSEPSVAAHMKDDYWADILINVEEPISSLKKKKDKSKTKTSKTKELQAEAATPKELPVSMGNVEPEEPKAAECKQDNTENGKAEAKPPMVANGGQQANAEETAENLLLTGLVMHFSRPDAVPSHSDLVKIFSQYGPVSEARTQTGNSVNSATVIFKRRMDAEGAFCGAGNMTNVLGPGLVSFRLSDFPSGASGNGARQGASSEQRPW